MKFIEIEENEKKYIVADFEGGVLFAHNPNISVNVKSVDGIRLVGFTQFGTNTPKLEQDINTLKEAIKLIIEQLATKFKGKFKIDKDKNDKILD